MELTPRAGRILRLAEQRAKDLGQERVGAEHLLLAICDEPDGVPAHVLRELQMTEALRDQLLEIVTSPGYDSSSALGTDTGGTVVGQVVTFPDGAKLFLDREGKHRPGPAASS